MRNFTEKHFQNNRYGDKLQVFIDVNKIMIPN